MEPAVRRFLEHHARSFTQARAGDTDMEAVAARQRQHGLLAD